MMTAALRSRLTARRSDRVRSAFRYYAPAVLDLLTGLLLFAAVLILLPVLF